MTSSLLISLTHLAPFVDVSRRKIRATVVREFAEMGIEITGQQQEKIVEERLQDEVCKGIQTIQ